ncbi:MAG TPA: FKBP-type peptidyl-prolyl cis-trans isomerase [Brumimicrobium sp.]|nr:FKBP-type peptidyl-prolyl cis-trans isomerase [Brumimicrobium sp.]
MRKLMFIPLLALVVACNNGTPKNASDIKLDDFEQRISYALGADMGANFQNVPEEVFSLLNQEELANGFYDALANKAKVTEDECSDILNTAFSSAAGIDTSQYSMKQISNCYGFIFGEMLKSSLATKKALDKVNLDIVKIGFSEALLGTDTLIEINERNQMIMNFNNDLNRDAGEEFLANKKKEFPDAFHDVDYVLVTKEEGTGEAIDLSLEYDVVYTLTNIDGDTIISTYQDLSLPEEQNSQIVNGDDIVFPEAWKLAADQMKIGGSYTIYSTFALGFGEDGLRSPNMNSFIVQPYSAITIHSKVLSQDERFGAVKRKGQEVIEKAKKEPNTIVDPSGFVLTTLEAGTGKNVPVGGDVKAHYVLTNSSGEVVEDSYMTSAQGNRPAPTFSLNGVVEGWQLGIPKMKVGGKYRLVLPYNLAYGENGNRGIQPFETLTFEIEVLEAGEAGSLVQAQQQQQISEEQLRQLQEQLQNQ